MKTITRRLLAFLIAVSAIHGALVLTAFAKPLSISAVKATNISSDRATITWTTSAPATSQVEYGETTSYGSSTLVDNTLVTSHSVLITGLWPNKTYHYRVISRPSPSGTPTVSGDYTFTTPVLYEIKFWELPIASLSPHPTDFNNHGQGVGYMEMLDGERHAYLYDNATGLAVDLHTLYSGPGTAVPDGWRVNSATGINDHGAIVGNLVPMGNPIETSIPYIIDPQGANRIFLLPDFGPPGSRSAYVRINNNYDILTMCDNADGSFSAYFYNYQKYLLGIDTLQQVPGSLLFRGAISPISLNNATPAQVSGQFSDWTPFLWTSGPGGGLQTFPRLQTPLVTGMNDAGVLCGETTKQGQRYPMRLSTATLNLLTGAPNYQAFSINNSGDVLLSAGSSTTDRSNLIFHDELGYFDLDKLVTGTDADLADWLTGSPLAWFVNDRDSTGFGQITGVLWFSDGTQRPFILTPIAP